MHIITYQMLLDMLHQANVIKQMYFDTLLTTAWHSILGYFPSLFSAIGMDDWSTVAAYALTLIGLVVFIYRLVCKNLWMAIRGISDR